MSPDPLRAVAIAALTTALVATSSLQAVAAQPDGTFRFWSLWSADNGVWRPEPGNAALVELPARSAVAWHFVSGPTQLDQSHAPDVPADFRSLCPDPLPGTGTPVAVVIDPGDLTEAPPGQTPPDDRVECIRVPGAPTAASALAAAAVAVRAGEEGIVCAIDGYPTQECAAAVSEQSAAAPAPADDTPTRSGPALWPLSLALLLAFMGAYLIVMRRRRQR